MLLFGLILMSGLPLRHSAGFSPASSIHLLSISSIALAAYARYSIFQNSRNASALFGLERLQGGCKNIVVGRIAAVGVNQKETVLLTAGAS